MNRYKYKCDICYQDYDDKALYGEFISHGKLDLHYYCLLSANIPQRGSLKNEFRGFLESDINKLLEECKNNKCIYCNESRAAVKCAAVGCDRTWHYKCGQFDGCITQFIGNFNSFCHSHVPVTNSLKNLGCYCRICYYLIMGNDPAKCIFSDCCLKSVEYCEWRTMENIQQECFSHANCIQRYVTNAGVDSKCPHCPMETMTKEEWQNQMRKKGIFVPEKMASWESDDYFKQQTKNKCGNPECKTPKITKNVWCCFVCGCHPLHLKCSGASSHSDYLCQKCINESFVGLVPNVSKRHRSSTSSKQDL